MRTSLLIALLYFLSIGTTHAEEQARQRRVMTWVPPYAVSECQKRLKESFNGVGMKDGITHLGLQFWKPTKKGGVQLVTRFNAINDSKVAEFRRWGNANGVRVMLCIYNATPSGWDWELATSAFDTHREQFVKAIVSETLRLRFDGVDIDFEGKGKLDASREAFVRFIRDLSGRLHAKGKELTVDSFAYKWHAPNQNWWPSLLPHIDGLHVMGYSETGAGAADWRAYKFLKAAAGKHASKLMIGMPGNVARWQNAPAGKHIQWVVDDPSVGMAIWDAQLKDPVWRTRETWQAISKIEGRSTQANRSPPSA